MPTRFAATALLLALALALPGCVARAGSEAKAAHCNQSQPIHWSSPDTAENVAGVKAHNAVGKRLCSWRPSP